MFAPPGKYAMTSREAPSEYPLTAGYTATPYGGVAVPRGRRWRALRPLTGQSVAMVVLDPGLDDSQERRAQAALKWRYGARSLLTGPVVGVVSGVLLIGATKLPRLLTGVVIAGVWAVVAVVVQRWLDRRAKMAQVARVVESNPDDGEKDPVVGCVASAHRMQQLVSDGAISEGEWVQDGHLALWEGLAGDQPLSDYVAYLTEYVAAVLDDPAAPEQSTHPADPSGAAPSGPVANPPTGSDGWFQPWA